MRSEFRHEAALDADELEVLFGPGVHVACSPLTAGLKDLLPEERQHVERSVISRTREFATGRVLARQLLRRLGLDDAPLLAGRDRCPHWPEGTTGSISHTDDVCVVAVTLTDEARAIGIDVEPFEPLDLEVWDEVFVESESSWLEAQPSSQRGFLARTLFSAKESAYKCQYPLTRRVLEFSDVEVSLSVKRETFRARCIHALPGGLALELLDGKLAISADRIVTGMVLRV